MRLVVQRVKNAKVEVDNRLVSQIDKGLLVFLGVTFNDTENDVKRLAQKLVNLRIFADDQDKMNLSVKDIQGEILLVSQFTLYADIKKGNRPSFTESAGRDLAISLYEAFIQELKNLNISTKSGIFGANMQISLVNDGPVTIIVDSCII